MLTGSVTYSQAPQSKGSSEDSTEKARTDPAGDYNLSQGIGNVAKSIE